MRTVDPLELVDAVDAIMHRWVDDRHAPQHTVRVWLDHEELVARVGNVERVAVGGQPPPLLADVDVDGTQKLQVGQAELVDLVLLPRQLDELVVVHHRALTKDVRRVGVGLEAPA